MTIRASTLTAAAETLRAVEGKLVTAAEWAAQAFGNVESHLTSLDDVWSGPYPAAHRESTIAYLDGVRPLSGGYSSAASAVGRWANWAESLAGYQARYEAVLAVSGWMTAITADADTIAAIEAAERGRAEVDERWVEVCTLATLELGGGGGAGGSTGQLEACATAIAVPVEQRAVAPGGSYTNLLIALGAMADIDLADIDSSGSLQAVADEAIDAYLSSEFAPLMYSIMETANQANILDADDKLTRDDLWAATDPAVVSGLIAAWERATGVDLPADTEQQLCASIVASAWIMLGSDNDRWKDVDDTLDREPLLQAQLTEVAVNAYVNAGVPSIFYDPDAPTDPVERYIAAGGGAPFPESLEAVETASELELWVNGPTSYSGGSDWDTPGDWFRNVVFDWEAFYGDNASVGGASLQIFGVLPWGRGAQALRALKWADEGLAMTDDAAAALDDLVAMGDDAVAALDNPTFLDEVGDGLVDDVAEVADGPDPRRIYSVNGEDYAANAAPETLVDTQRAPAGDLVGDVLDDGSVFAQHGIDEPWTSDELIAKINTPIDELTPAEQAVLVDIRNSIPMPVEGEFIQKVIDPATAQRYLANLVVDGGFDAQRVRGFVTTASDTVHLTTPGEIFDGLALNYSGTPFNPDEQTVAVLRLPADANVVDNVSVPQATSLGGSYDAPPPYTGNGFTATGASVIPEYQLESVRLPAGTEMWEVTQSGTQRLIGVYDGGTWVVVP